MSQKNMKAIVLSAFIFALVWSFSALPAKAQTADELSSLKEQVAKLLNADKYTEALPILERLAKVEPDNADTQFYLGFTLLAQAKNTKDKEAARQLNVRARQSFVRAKQLGSTQKVLNAFIESLPENGIIENQFSKNNEADDSMQQAEAAFTQGKIDEALKLIKKPFLSTRLFMPPHFFPAICICGRKILPTPKFGIKKPLLSTRIVKRHIVIRRHL